MTKNEIIQYLENMYKNLNTLTEADVDNASKELMKEARKLGIHLEVQMLIKRAKELVKEQNSKVKSLEYDYNNLPLRNYTEIEKAAQWFEKNRVKFPYTMRCKMAKKILKAAKSHAVSIPESARIVLEKSAGIGIGDVETITQQLELRLQYLEKNAVKEAKKLGTVIKKLKNIDPSVVYKTRLHASLVADIDTIDRQYGVVYKYASKSSKFLPPEDFVYSICKKEMEPILSLVGNVKTGKYYKPEDLAKLDMNLGRDYLGEGFCKEATVCGIVDVDMLRDWFKTASYHQATIFDILAEESGIKPYAQKLPEKAI